jgi:hypothetical protein
VFSSESPIGYAVSTKRDNSLVLEVKFESRHVVMFQHEQEQPADPTTCCRGLVKRPSLRSLPTVGYVLAAVFFAVYYFGHSQLCTGLEAAAREATSPATDAAAAVAVGADDSDDHSGGVGDERAAQEGEDEDDEQEQEQEGASDGGDGDDAFFSAAELTPAPRGVPFYCAVPERTWGLLAFAAFLAAYFLRMITATVTKMRR